MKLLASTIPVLLVSAVAAQAAMGTATFDRNGDRFVSFSELAAVLPTVTQSDFNRLDVNDDRRLSANEVSAPDAQSVFGRYLETSSSVQGMSEIDTNGDRFATFTELAAAHPGIRRSDFDDIDTNNDRRVSQIELYEGTAQEILTRYESGSSILVSMNEIDLDGSGFASLEELSSLYPGLTAYDYHSIDRNRDNRVSFEELYDLETIVILGENR